MKKLTALAALLAIPAMADPAGYFQIPGTDTTLKLYGQIQIREAYGFNGNGVRDVTDYFPTTSEASTGHKNEDFQQKGQWSGNWRYYMGVTTTTPSPYGDVKTVIYGRFRHNSGTPSGQDVKFNLEQAYIQVHGLKIGTDWSMFGYAAWEPNTLYGCVADEDGTWATVRQLSYMFSPVKGLDLGLALESDNSGPDDAKNNYLGSQQGTSNNTHPNISAVAAYSADWGGVTAAVNWQQRKDWEKGSAKDKNRTGDGLSWILSGGWNITPNDQLTAMILKAGEGYGSTHDGFYVDGNDYSFYKSLATSLGYTHTWNDQFSSALVLARTTWDKDVTAQTALGYLPDDYKADEYIVNTTWQVTKTVSCGIEYQYTQLKGDQRNWVDDHGNKTDKDKLDMIRFKIKATLW